PAPLIGAGPGLPPRAKMLGPPAKAGVERRNHRIRNRTSSTSRKTCSRKRRKPPNPSPPPKKPWPNSRPPMPAPIRPPISPDMKPDPRLRPPPMPAPAPAKPGEGAGVFGVMLRWNGVPELGAVRVEGGADQVMLPRLPNEEPPPARASANVGARISANAVRPANREEVRRRT